MTEKLPGRVSLAAALASSFLFTVTAAAQPLHLGWTSSTGSLQTMSDEDVRELSDLVRLIVLQNLPHSYENTKEWGGTKEVWAGIKISQEGMRLTTKRRKKTVNHGSWKRYQVQLVNLSKSCWYDWRACGRFLPKGPAFDLVVDAHLFASGRWSEWRQGVQLFSVSAEAEARLRLCVVRSRRHIPYGRCRP